MTTAAVLEEVRTFRRAARAIVRADHRDRVDRLRALIDLAKEARRSDTEGLAAEVVWVEAAPFIRNEEPEPLESTHPVDTAQLGLLRRGYVRCPECRRALQTEDEIARGMAERIREIERRELFEAAGR